MDLGLGSQSNIYGALPTKSESYNTSPTRGPTRKPPGYKAQPHQLGSAKGEKKSRENQNFKVVVRVRPPLPREIGPDGYFSPVT